MPKIFHITHIENLPGIAEEGGLYSDNGRIERDLGTISIAYEHIKRRRANRVVPVKPGGTLADYVPFYFSPRSPMLYAIHMGGVEGYQGGQEAVLHLVSSIDDIVNKGLKFVFTDGHADVWLSKYFDDLDGLAKLDWQIMKAIFWHDTIADGDRKRRRQAEFLVHDFLPFSLVAEIGVMSEGVANTVRALLHSGPHQPEVSVRRGWYY